MEEIKRNISILTGEITDESGEIVGRVDHLSGEITDKSGNTKGWYDVFSGEVTDTEGETKAWVGLLSGDIEDTRDEKIGSYNLLSGEYKDGEKGILDGDPCFVATAVYGDNNAPQVQILREFRDKVLMESNIGRSFVNFYYSGAGRKTANFIKNQLPSTIPAIRRGLDLLVERYSAQRK